MKSKLKQDKISIFKYLKKHKLALLMYVFANKQVLDTFLYSTFRISNHVRSYKNAKDRVNKLFDDNVYKTEKFGTETIDDFKGTIEFKNVSFKYKDVNLETGEIKNSGTFDELFETDEEFKKLFLIEVI